MGRHYINENINMLAEEVIKNRQIKNQKKSNNKNNRLAHKKPTKLFVQQILRVTNSRKI